MSLTRSAVSGMAWTWGATATNAVLQLAYTAVMSRLLDPADFGLMAAALLALRFIAYLSRFGLGSAVVQRPGLTDAEAATALRVSVAVGAVCALASVALGGGLASLVGNADAAGVLRWMSVSLFLGSVTLVPEGILRRRLAFRGLATAQVASFALGYLGVGFGMAAAGAGVWSLVGATTAQSLILLIATLFLARPPWRGRSDRAAVRSLMSFGGTVSLTGFLEFLGSSLDTVMVGRWIGTQGLGQYSRATYLVGLPVEQATTAMTRVMLPGLSQVQHEPRRFSGAVLRASSVMAAIVIVPMLAVAAAAPAVVRVLLGPGWGQAASVLPVVGAAYGLSLLTHLPAVAAEAVEVIRVKLAIQVVALAATVAAVGLVAATGPTLHRLAIAWFVGQAVTHGLYWLYVIPRLGIDRRELALRYLAAGALAAALAIPLLVTVRLLDAQGVLGLAIGGLSGGMLLLLAAWSPVAALLRQDLSHIRSAIRPSVAPTSAVEAEDSLVLGLVEVDDVVEREPGPGLEERPLGERPTP